tara:strand:+ start:3397 stop:3993 length:597 start_codon:yes stop_codon:yes gene_type:complete
MIKIKQICNDEPYLVFKDLYEKTLKTSQKNIEAVCISSFSESNNEVNSRYVNLKFIIDRDFIFFSNYESPKSKEFKEHSQISALVFWPNTNVQIRMKAVIKRTSKKFNEEYFKKRDKEKNALAISSRQSCITDSYDDVKEKFNRALRESNLQECPDYWGGYSLRPYYFEFWEGHKSRLNKRVIYQAKGSKWISNVLQP